MGSFAGLLQSLTISRVSECFVEVGARIPGALIRNTIIDTEQQSATATAWEGYQTKALGIPDWSLCKWKVLCTGVESNGGKSMWKFDDFIANLGGRRPPQRVRAYNSTNNHELNNTLIEPHQVISSGSIWVVAVVELLTWLFTDVTSIWKYGWTLL